MKNSPSEDKVSAALSSRRDLIINAGLAAGAVSLFAVTAISTPATAQGQKMAPGDIGYQSRPNGAQRCELCVNWQPPAACKLVAGSISPSGWCGLFVRKA